MKLTQEGFIFRQRAEEIVAMVDKTSAEFLSMDKPLAGDIYIGGGETLAVSLIADLIAELRKEYPDIRYHLYSGNEADVTEHLDTRKSIFKKSGFKSYIYISGCTNYWTEHLENDII